MRVSIHNIQDGLLTLCSDAVPKKRNLGSLMATLPLEIREQVWQETIPLVEYGSQNTIGEFLSACPEAKSLPSFLENRHSILAAPMFSEEYLTLLVRMVPVVFTSEWCPSNNPYASQNLSAAHQPAALRMWAQFLDERGWMQHLREARIVLRLTAKRKFGANTMAVVRDCLDTLARLSGNRRHAVLQIFFRNVHDGFQICRAPFIKNDVYPMSFVIRDGLGSAQFLTQVLSHFTRAHLVRVHAVQPDIDVKLYEKVSDQDDKYYSWMQKFSRFGSGIVDYMSQAGLYI